MPTTTQNTSEETSLATPTTDVARFTKKRSKKKVIIIASIALVVVAIGLKILMPKNTSPIVSTTPITYGELVKMVNVSGTVESANTKKIFLPTTLGNAGCRIATINVKIGDSVKAGDVLLSLDTGEANRDLEDAKIAFEKSKIAYDAAQYDYALALSGSNVSSEALTMQDSVNQAVRNYYTVKEQVDALTDFDYAKFTKLRRAFLEAKKALENGTGSADDLYEKQALYDSLASELYDNMELLTKLENAFDTMELTRARLDIYQNKSVKEQADSAEMSLKSAELTFQQAKRSYDRVTGQMGDYVITSPITGVVTNINVTEGEPAGINGELATVSDINDLVVKSALKEFDVMSVTNGLAVTVKSDATGKTEFKGLVDSIAPTAASSTSNVEFPTKIKILSSDSGLRVGMNVRCSIILEKRENVFSVPYDSVVTNAEGQNVIYVITTQGKKSVVTAIPVETGMETDFYIEVSSEPLKEGDQIVTTTTGLTDGMEVMIMPNGMMG